MVAAAALGCSRSPLPHFGSSEVMERSASHRCLFMLAAAAAVVAGVAAEVTVVVTAVGAVLAVAAVVSAVAAALRLQLLPL